MERALQILGEGFTSNPRNAALRDGLRTGQVTPADLHGQLLRLVYRLIFLFVAEDRTFDGLPLLHPRDDSDAARTAHGRYAAHYGTGRLLALTPQISADGACFGFAEFAGNERKTSGSYYTPDSLVQCLLDSALEPVADEAIKGKTGADAEQAILAIRVCDPAVGSGHFLVGAAHRLARHLARVRALAQGDSEPSPLLYQHALRDVIGRCLYGVDINPMAAELCRVSLWLEALEPGPPLSFLDHHIRVGNSLIGATPELIATGIPDDAFRSPDLQDFNVTLVRRNGAPTYGRRSDG